MSKDFMFKFLIGITLVGLAVLWLLSVSMKDKFGWFSVSWAVCIATGIFGALLILRGMFSKTIGTFKKMYIYLGAGMLIICLYAFVSAYAFPDAYVLPIIAIIVAGALLVGMMATGGKKWDQGDNHNVGYKNYHQRKAEEEAARNKNK